MPQTAAQRARGVAKDRHKITPPVPTDRQRHIGRLGAIKSNIVQGVSVRVDGKQFDTPEKRADLLAVLKTSPIAPKVPDFQVDEKRIEAVAYAAKASRGLLRRLVRYAHDPRRKDAVRAAQVVLSVAGLMDGAKAKESDDGDPRDMSADGIRRMVFSAQARLSALEAVAERLSDAPSGPQGPQAADLAPESGQQAAPEPAKTPAEPAPGPDEAQPAAVQPGPAPQPFE